MEQENVTPLRPSYALFSPEIKQTIKTRIKPIVQDENRVNDTVTAVEDAICTHMVEKTRDAFTRLGNWLGEKVTRQIDKVVN